MSTKQKITIAVTGLNNTDNPGPGVPFIRGIKESELYDARIIGLAYENLEPGTYMPDVTDITYKVPYPSGGVNAFMERMQQITDVEHIDVLVPNFDAELYTIIKSEDMLTAMGIRTFLPTLKQFDERQKNNLPEYGSKYNIKVPFSKPIASVFEINNLKEEFEFPLVVKGKFYDAYIVKSQSDIEKYFYKISAQWGLPVVIQEFIEGTEVNVIALGDGNGNTVGAVSMKKQYITDKGKAWGGITIADEKLMEITRHIIAETKWRGGMELEMIRTNKGEYYLVEVNPRLPAWLYLAVGAGQNLPEAMIRLAMEEDVKPFEGYDIGKMFIRYSHDLLCDISQFQEFTTTGGIKISE